MLPAADIIELLNLQLNDQEGGYYANTYPAAGVKDPPCSAIYYFLDHTRCSVMHKVTSDMLYHFYTGDPVEMLLLYPEEYGTRTETCLFSNDIEQGGRPMKVIPAGTWLGARISDGGSWALMGVSMAPPFNPAGYFIGDRTTLIKEYPEQEKLIIELTNP